MPRFKTCFANAFWAKHVLKTKRWIFEAKQRFGRTLAKKYEFKIYFVRGRFMSLIYKGKKPWRGLLIFDNMDMYFMEPLDWRFFWVRFQKKHIN